MNRKMQKNKEQISVGNIMYWTVGALFIATMLSVWLVSGIFAKYIVSDNVEDSARVAKTGISFLELLEHNAKETYDDSGVYELETDKAPVDKNKYEKVLPGVDIPKDPFVRFEIKNSEVNYMLYLDVTESKYFPSNWVTYTIEDCWEKVSSFNGTVTYRYVDENGNPVVFKAGDDYSTGPDGIQILVDNMLYVSEHYEGLDKEFSLSFKAQLKQVY